MTISRRNLYILGGAVLLAVFVALFLLPRPSGEKEAGQDGTLTKEGLISSTPRTVVGRPETGPPDTLNLPPPPPIERLAPPSPSVNELIGEISERVLEQAPNIPPSLLSLFENLKRALPQPAAPTVQLSEEEIFQKIWPANVRDTLKDLGNLVIKDGVIVKEIPTSGGESGAGVKGIPIQNWSMSEGGTNEFKTDVDMYRSLGALLDESLKQGWIKDQEYKNLKKGLTQDLPLIVEKQKEALRKWGRFGGSASGSDLSMVPADPKKLIGDLFSFLSNLLPIAPEAKAFWYTFPDCYKDDIPVYPVPGFSLWDPFCNSGFYCAYGCTFVYDCGYQGVYCNVPIGCLNLICRAWPNAIWDAVWYPGTGICGCG